MSKSLSDSDYVIHYKLRYIKIVQFLSDRDYVNHYRLWAINMVPVTFRPWFRHSL
jgi:hypothetical protein